ncbi:MAG TPA: riboflavin biosynthesis protein RibF [Acidobacteriaceae bacterium]|nr:riboflavin biosynthesis protein RibF [Acidobacteriaceae bacterium]
MNIYTQLAELPADPTPVVATIGNFDGVHLGHQGVIAEVIQRARFLNARSLAITFDPHPARVLRPEHPHTLITPLPRKLELLAATGIDATLVLPFTDDLRRMSPRTFASEVLAHAIRVTEIHEGENFRFGYQAEANIASLETLGRELGFSAVIYAPRIVRGAPVSSSRIRDLVAAGVMNQARALLGRPFSIDSTPAPGRGYGTRYAVPTINLAPYPELLPSNGVYITTLAIGTGASAETFEAVTNVGTRPTFGAESFAVESHLLNFNPIDLTEATPVRLTFLRRLRDEQKFPTTEALRQQIARDVNHARRYFVFCQNFASARSS